jgi:hypothetical protein
MFNGLQEARDMCQCWQKDYNEERPHKALGYLSPVKYAEQSIPPSNPCLFELSSHLFLTKKYDKASFTLKDGEDY